MHRHFFAYFFFVLSFGLPLITSAQFASPFATANPSSKASLVAEPQAIAPGEPFWVALELQHPENWHSYYVNSGGVELPLSITWNLPEGFSAGSIQWPTPQVIDGFFGKSFVFIGNPIFLIEISPSANLAVGETVTLTADAHWQICEDTCINEEATLTLQLPVAAETIPAAENAPLFSRARANLPSPANDDWQVSARAGDSSVILQVSSPSESKTISDFVPDQAWLKSASDGGSVRQEGDSWTITLPKRSHDPITDEPIPTGDAVSGVLLADGGIKVTATPLQVAATQAAAFGAMVKILAAMFVGGLILNLMPCVFPVIGLKIMGFVQQAGAERKKIAFHGVMFTLGVLLSFGAISGILFLARSAVGGQELGWGYQLQNPWVVLSLMLLMFILALNMYGVFEIGSSATSIGGRLQSKQGVSGSFFSGMLATIVATPCSAPFLGAAIGASIALPALQFFAAFAAMALGLAFPYLLLSLFPQFVEKLPRPGAWMETFKQAMSFLLFATAGYLLWVYAAQTENLLGALFGLTCIAVAAWIYGRWNLPHRSRRARTLAFVGTLIFAGLGIALAKPIPKSAIEWQTWSQELVDELHAEGKPVYIDFTAQWCATCQFNKRVAYTDEVVALMQQKNIVALRADKTNADPAIEAKLRELGRSAIPVNVLHLPNEEPTITPELLTPGYLLELFATVPDDLSSPPQQ